TALMINKENNEWAPVPEFLNVPGFIRDLQMITDAARGRTFSNAMMALALLKNYRPFKAPGSLALVDLLKKFDKSFALRGEAAAKKAYGDSGPNRTYEDALKRRSDPWNFLFIAGMWFQDLFNYDFRRTEMCIIPYATQQGEISFCAYNTGIGWRKIIENMHKNATVAEWYKSHGKHEIYARGKSVSLENYEHSLNVDAADAARVREREHDVPMTAAEEDKLRRKAAWEAQQARQLYEELVLKKAAPELVQIGSPSAKPAPQPEPEKVSV
ncbi:MAG: radical SAM protein, partial [Terriglobia bacterium]